MTAHVLTNGHGRVSDGGVALGQRIAAARRLRGLTQDGLAQRLHRSASWVTKVERGVRQIESASVLRDVACALDVSVHELTGDPGEAGVPTGRKTGTGAGSGASIEALSAIPCPSGPSWAGLARVLDQPGSLHSADGTCPGRSVAELRREAAALRHLHNTSGRSAATIQRRLPGLIVDAERTVRVCPPSERTAAHAALCGLYRVASLQLRQHGELATARIAVDRAAHAADNTGDPLLVASVAATMTVQLMLQGKPHDAVALAHDITRHVDRCPKPMTPADNAAALVVRGCLYLYAAQAAARARQEPEALRLLEQARRIGDELGHDREERDLTFGPTSVAIQQVGILVDLNQPRRALDRGGHVHPERLHNVNRAGYHHLHLARAHSLLGDTDATAAALTTAWHAAPDLLRHHRSGRHLLTTVLRRKRHVDEHLRRLAHHLHVLA